MTIFGVVLRDENYIIYITQMGSVTRTIFLFLAKSLLILSAVGVSRFIQKYIPLERYKYLIALGVLGVIFVYITYNFSSIYALAGWIGYVVFAVMLFGIFYLHSMWKKAENDRKVLDLKTKSYIEYYENLLKVQEDKQRLLHDLRYQYLNIFQMLDEEKYPDCKRYLGKILNTLEENGYVQFTGNHYIDFIVNYKKHEAEKKGISVKVDADIVGNIIEFHQEDINVVFGNLLDNAIEACEKIYDGERWITIHLDRVKGMLFITIINSTKGLPNIAGGEVITSKKDSQSIHGLGIKSVRRCVEKYNGIFNVEFDRDVFKVSMTLFI